MRFVMLARESSCLVWVGILFQERSASLNLMSFRFEDLILVLIIRGILFPILFRLLLFVSLIYLNQPALEFILLKPKSMLHILIARLTIQPFTAISANFLHTLLVGTLQISPSWWLALKFKSILVLIGKPIRLKSEITYAPWGAT